MPIIYGKTLMSTANDLKDHRYRVPLFTTVQDYMKMETANIWLYDRLHKKRRRVTLRVSSSKKDLRKTEISTFVFVNFIHQRDAHIAMSVVG